MAFRIQIRRDTAEKWMINNPILLEGEIGYETDTTYIKIGDGTTYWNDLPYWNGGVTGAGLIVKEGSVTILSPTNTINFTTDFNVTATSSSEVSVALTNSGGGGGASDVNVFGDNGVGVTGATGLNFKGSQVQANGKFATITQFTYPYFSVTASLSGGNFSQFTNSKGPDELPLTGGSWNYSFSNAGNNLTITHNSGARPLSLNTHSTNNSNIFIKSPVGTSTSQFTLASNISHSAFTVYGVNSANTGADGSGNVEIVWTFGTTL
jgi:hypothetical protein